MCGAVCASVTACMVWAARFGRGSVAKTRVQQCIAHLCVVAGTGRARFPRQLAVAHWAERLPIIAADGGRVLRPMLLASAQEPRPFCLICDTCHAALSDRSGAPQIWLGTPDRWLSPPPKPVSLATDGNMCYSVLKLCVYALLWLPAEFSELRFLLGTWGVGEVKAAKVPKVPKESKQIWAAMRP